MEETNTESAIDSAELIVFSDLHEKTEKAKANAEIFKHRRKIPLGGDGKCFIFGKKKVNAFLDNF